MLTLAVEELESRYSEVLDTFNKGGEIFLTSGGGKKIVGQFILIVEEEKKKGKRKLGILKGKMNATWVGDGKITGEELDEMLSPIKL
ncbi:MAG: hypothetical protein NWQ46_05330 [Spirosomaceae bacterium]|nr:hypothetical protein [Spirosomataceae bacterium]